MSDATAWQCHVARVAVPRGKVLAAPQESYPAQPLSLTLSLRVRISHTLAVERLLCSALQLPPPPELDAARTEGNTCTTHWDSTGLGLGERLVEATGNQGPVRL